jgi:hypothetical protein
MFFAVAPFDQRWAVPVLADNVTLPPAQKVVAPLAEIVGVGAVPIVMVVANTYCIVSSGSGGDRLSCCTV